MRRLPSGTRIETFDTLDSTSAEARRRSEAGATEPVWIVALRQTDGYGRRGRRWEQDAGDFAGTLLFKPEAPPEHWGQLSFVIALGLASAFDGLVGEDKIDLKWPNDVLLDGGKCAGILLENLGRHLSIGVGVNMVTAPEGMPYKVTRLVDYVLPPPGPGAFAASLDGHFQDYYGTWVREGFAPIRDIWLKRARGVAAKITVRLPNAEFSGVFEGIDETGALILRTGEGTRTIAAGDVFFSPQPED
ncbi:biotin--[acetyl-CoA-carboxylase] ligase [Hyphococcus sp.]|uniref:biotin--[acetyl-CoA-carboxylase] ligase n=1 Tax=Hyphococcus sp. TaxID=2038636 RepID=UPI003D0C4595